MMCQDCLLGNRKSVGHLCWATRRILFRFGPIIKAIDNLSISMWLNFRYYSTRYIRKLRTSIMQCAHIIWIQHIVFHWLGFTVIKRHANSLWFHFVAIAFQVHPLYVWLYYYRLYKPKSENDWALGTTQECCICPTKTFSPFQETFYNQHHP